MIRPLILAAAMLLAPPAGAHDIFTGTHDPVTGYGCCNGDGSPSTMGPDCARVPKEMLDAGVITEVQGGYHVKLTLEQARFFDKHASKPVEEDIPWKRVQGGLDRGFALCVHVDQIQCFFTSSNT